MQSIADRLSNPFGMQAPCMHACSEEISGVYGYGDPNADFHLIGDHPGRHGGETTGIPFTGKPASDRLLAVLADVNLVDITGTNPSGSELFMSYLHLCCPSDGTNPTEAEYQDLERFFDAELRAVAAHVLLPVGRKPLQHVLEHFTSHPYQGITPSAVHAAELSGRGFLVIPIKDPSDWRAHDEEKLKATLTSVLDSDYNQETDLTRFFPTNRQYLVR